MLKNYHRKDKINGGFVRFACEKIKEEKSETQRKGRLNNRRELRNRKSNSHPFCQRGRQGVYIRTE
jgi:hypothetical protein